MKWGMTDEQYSILENLVIKPLKSHGCEVYIFGSRAKGSHHPHSDVDLLFKKSDGKPFPAGFLSEIKEQIDESRFPFIVDLVDEQELAQSYRDSVFFSRIPL
ncbi:nucleotidyltransferase family protein [Bdellovibrio bacteriovorus]|uniref:nucleotidyltransferase family protein n=1 Tax=Bdellovibrio TaxID=958 RepID=UPI0035A9A5BD